MGELVKVSKFQHNNCMEIDVFLVLCDGPIIIKFKLQAYIKF